MTFSSRNECLGKPTHEADAERIDKSNRPLCVRFTTDTKGWDLLKQERPALCWDGVT